MKKRFRIYLYILPNSLTTKNSNSYQNISIFRSLGIAITSVFFSLPPKNEQRSQKQGTKVDKAPRAAPSKKPKSNSTTPADHQPKSDRSEKRPKNNATVANGNRFNHGMKSPVESKAPDRNTKQQNAWMSKK